VSSHYDPLIAKLATWGRDRDEAIARMRRALAQTVILGVETNLPLHLRILADPDFQAGTSVTTRYIGDHPHVIEPTPPATGELAAAIAAAAAARVAQSVVRQGTASQQTLPSSQAWPASARWRR